MKSRIYLATALTTGLSILAAGPVSAAVIAPPVGPPTAAVNAASAAAASATAAKIAADKSVAAATTGVHRARAAVLSAGKSVKATQRAARVLAAAQKRLAAAKVAQAAAAKVVGSTGAKYKTVYASEQAAYRVRRPAITAANIDRLGHRLAYDHYSVNPTYYLAAGLKGEKAVGGIRVSTGSYRTTAAGIWYGTCVTNYSTPAPVSNSTRAVNIRSSYAALIRYGFSSPAAASTMAMVLARSNVDPTKTSGGFGLLAWSDAASVRATAKKAGISAKALSFQLSYLIHQVRASSVLTAASRATTTAAASAGLAKGFGIPVTAPTLAKATTFLKKYDHRFAIKTDNSCTTPAMNTYAAKYISLIGTSKLRGWYDNKWYTVAHMCQKNSQSVWKMVGGKNIYDGITGNAVDIGFYMLNHGKLHPWTGYAPRGALVWWDNAIGGGYGHVAVSDGAGNFINNWNTGKISSTSFASLGVTPMGWADPSTVYGPKK